jgi:tryptophan synthase alpha chain
VGEAVAQLKRHTALPVVVGFGVKNAEGAAAIAEAADGVVVGSLLVDAIRLSLNGGAATSSTVGAVTGLVETLARSVQAVRK